MLISRTVGKFTSRLLIGVLVFAQVALAAYACPSAPSAMMSAAGTGAIMGAGQATAELSEGMPSAAWHIDPVQPSLCGAHCQSGQQNVDVKPAPTPPIALIARYFTLEPSAQGAGPARPFRPAHGPPPVADPPHAILHCCLRI